GEQSIGGLVRGSSHRRARVGHGYIGVRHRSELPALIDSFVSRPTPACPMERMVAVPQKRIVMHARDEEQAGCFSCASCDQRMTGYSDPQITMAPRASRGPTR
ncbi:MAG: hypothetical protein ACYS5V_15260, partial [Planctomycetota bacterium]